MEQVQINQPDHVLLTGATGYIGGRLAPRLLDSGYFVRCLVRNPRKLSARPWAEHPRVDIIGGDAGDFKRLVESMRGCGAAYYLIHSMVSAGPEYRKHDRYLAGIFARAAREAGVGRIIYLGGLGETGEGLSEHLSSRREVEEELASGPVPVTVLRAAMIIGSGSASYEILRYLVERLPVITPPLAINTLQQPISVRNVLNYLIDCLRTPETIGKILDIGGPDVMSYREMMQVMAEAHGLGNRLIIPVPAISPRLAAWWIQLITPISHRIALPLSEGVRNQVICRNDDAVKLMPQELLNIRESIAAADVRISSNYIETAWSDAGVMPGDPDWSGGTNFTNVYQIDIDATPEEVYKEISCIGGEHGYYGADWLWALRGIMDQVIGGPGLRRGRKDSKHVAYGDAIDFWRVIEVEPAKRLVLRAEMALPGDADLEFDIIQGEGNPTPTRLVSTARFKPRGLAGLMYWFSVLPLHRFVFLKMLHGIKHAVESKPAPSVTRPESGDW